MIIAQEPRVGGQVSNKRSNRRVSLIREIECEGETGRVLRKMADLSVGGMFIDGLASFKPGTTITTRFHLPEGPVATDSRVVYVQEGIGAGIEFQDLKSDDRRKIEELVRSLSSKGYNYGGMVSRVLISLPVTLKGTEKNGDDFVETASIVMVSKNGASIRTEMNIGLETRVVLGLPKGIEFEGRVLGLGREEIWIQCRGLAHCLGFQFP